MKGQLQNGKLVDLLPGSATPMQEPSNEKPTLVSAQYPTDRWRKYLMNMSDYENKDLVRPHTLWSPPPPSLTFIQRPYFAQYLCRKWNSGHHHSDEKLRALEIVLFQVNPTRPDFSGECISTKINVYSVHSSCECSTAACTSGSNSL